MGLRMSTRQQLLLQLMLLWLAEVSVCQTVAIAVWESIEMSKFAHNFWYFITVRAKANEAGAANAGAADSAAND